MPRRDNLNLSTTPIVKELRALGIASDSYDLDNVYFTEEGWVYRHYKYGGKHWDEILVAGQVDVTDDDNKPVFATVSASPDRVNLGTTTDADIDADDGFEEGDDKKDHEYGMTRTFIGDLTITGDAAAADGDAKNYVVAAAGDAKEANLKYTWHVTGDAAVTDGQGTKTAEVTFTYETGSASVACEVICKTIGDDVNVGDSPAVSAATAVTVSE